MVSIENEERPDILRQMALLLHRENQHLHERIKNLTIRIGQLEGKDAAALQLEIEHLQEMLARRERALFGVSSEKRPGKGSRPEPEPAPQTGHGPTAQPHLPVIEETLELAPGERVCPSCSGSLDEMGEQAEESEEITVVQRRFYLRKLRRQKYRCRCNGAVVTTPAPPKLIPGGRYSTEFAAEVAVGKYLDHSPLERQSRTMGGEGLVVSSQTLWDQIEALARVLEPSYQALHERVLSSPVVHADETHWRLMDRQGSSKWWVWSLASQEVVFYRLCGTRSAKAARAILAGYEGTVMCDGYSAYKTLAQGKKKSDPRAGPPFRLAHCWAHVRRKFVEAKPNYPEPCAAALDLIGELFAVERTVRRGAFPVDEEALKLRQQLRCEHSKELVDELKGWALDMRSKVLPRSGLGKAIHYLLNHLSGLSLFLEDPRIPLDNNLAERELRGVVLGRKNHYGSRSKRGTEVAALFYSLLETAKLVGEEPRAYLLRATRAALNVPGTVTLPEAPGS